MADRRTSGWAIATVLLLAGCQSTAPTTELEMAGPPVPPPTTRVVRARPRKPDPACRPTDLTAERKQALFRQFAAQQEGVVETAQAPGAPPTSTTTAQCRPAAR